MERIYQTIFNRAGDPGGVTYWTKQLDLKRRTRGQVMIGFSDASEGKRLFAHRVGAAVLWALLLDLGLSADAMAAVTGWLADGMSLAGLADKILNAPEYRTRIRG